MKASISNDEFEKGFNRALVGNEIIDFQNATLLGTDGQGKNQYRLDRLKRGLSYTIRDNLRKLSRCQEEL